MPKTSIAGLRKVRLGTFSVYSVTDSIDPATLLDKFVRARTLEDKGRGGLKLLSINDTCLACRKYVHGGIGRALTKDLFLSTGRALKEIDVMLYLKAKGFPVVEPVGILVGEDFPFKKPHIITKFEDNVGDLLEFLKVSSTKQRRRAIRDLADSLRNLQNLGIYHPDLHLRNILVKDDGRLIFLDFDKARRKDVSGKDVENMAWRLNRFAQKWEKKGYFRVTGLERSLFLRRYSRLSGYNLEERMVGKMKTKNVLARIGWLFESMLYGRR